MPRSASRAACTRFTLSPSALSTILLALALTGALSACAPRAVSVSASGASVVQEAKSGRGEVFERCLRLTAADADVAPARAGQGAALGRLAVTSKGLFWSDVAAPAKELRRVIPFDEVLSIALAEPASGRRIVVHLRTGTEVFALLARDANAIDDEATERAWRSLLNALSTRSTHNP